MKMTTTQDTRWTERFPNLDASAFKNNNTTFANWTPTQNLINTGMMSDIGRVTCFEAEVQKNPFARFMKSPLERGDTVMEARFSQITSRAFDPNAPDTALFNGNRPSMYAEVQKKNFDRQATLEVNNRWLKQFVQTQEMIGDAEACIQASLNVCVQDDMYTASLEYFGGSARGATADQQYVMTHAYDDDGFAQELIEKLYEVTQNKFAYKSTHYNAVGYNTKSEQADIFLTKECDFPTNKMMADTFHPDRLKVPTITDFVDSYPTQAGKPADAGDLIGIIVDPRAYAITPMPDGFTTTAFDNPARISTTFFANYSVAFTDFGAVNKFFIYAPGE